MLRLAFFMADSRFKFAPNAVAPKASHSCLRRSTLSRNARVLTNTDDIDSASGSSSLKTCYSVSQEHLGTCMVNTGTACKAQCVCVCVCVCVC